VSPGQPRPCEAGPRPQGQTPTSWRSWLGVRSGPNSRRCARRWRALSAHHAFLASQLLAHLDYIDETIATVSERIEAVIAPFAEELARLDTIHAPGQPTPGEHSPFA
jgi:hypothetical protein